MRTAYLIITIFFMLSMAELFGQKTGAMVDWLIGGVIPPEAGQAKSLGVAGAVCGSHGNIMFIAGGANFPEAMPWKGGKKQYHDRIYVYSQHGKKLVEIANKGTLPEPIAYVATCTTPQGVFYAGGENETGISKKTYLLRWVPQKSAVETETLPNLPTGVTNAAATVFGNLVIVASGENSNGVSDQIWFLDLQKKDAGWISLPALPRPVSHTVLVSMEVAGDKRLYLLGGRKKNNTGISELYNSVYEFSVVHNQWKELPPLPYALSAGTGVALDASRIMLFGGDRGSVFSQVENYLAAIGKTTDMQEKEKLILKKNQLLNSHPGFSKEILLYDVTKGTSIVAGMIPFEVPVTTTAFWWHNTVIIPSGEIKAGVRTPQILTATIHTADK